MYIEPQRNKKDIKVNMDFVFYFSLKGLSIEVMFNTQIVLIAWV